MESQIQLIVMSYYSIYIRLISYFLIAIFLFQSCVVYNNKQPVTAEKALEDPFIGVKIKTVDGNKFKFKRIEEGHEGIYGFKHLSDTIGLFMHYSTIEEIHLYNDAASRKATFKIIISVPYITGLVIVIAIIIAIISGEAEFGWTTSGP